jgi:hypothetical protein
MARGRRLLTQNGCSTGKIVMKSKQPLVPLPMGACLRYFPVSSSLRMSSLSHYLKLVQLIATGPQLPPEARAVPKNMWSQGSNNGQGTRAGTAHKKLHVNFPIKLAYTFKIHLDIFIFIKECIQVTDFFSCSERTKWPGCCCAVLTGMHSQFTRFASGCRMGFYQGPAFQSERRWV